MGSPEKVRIDKWLWSVRIYKSRTHATEACRSNQVRIDGTLAKSSSTVQRDNIIDVRKGGFHLTFKVIDLIEKRVSAPLAQQCYEDLTPEEERNKFKDWFIGKARPEIRSKGAGRPTKKERRVLEAYKNRRKN